MAVSLGPNGGRPGPDGGSPGSDAGSPAPDADGVKPDANGLGPDAGSATHGDPGDRHFVTALARGLQLLRCFRSGEELLGNQQLAERCGLPKSTVTRLTYTLTRLGYLHHNTQTGHTGHAGRYRLGLAALGIGGATLARLEVREKSRPVMQALADATGTQLALTVRDELAMLYVETCRPGNILLLLVLDVGSRIPLGLTAAGRACLAGMDAAHRRPLLARLQTLDEAGWPAVERGIRQAQAKLAELGCCGSFGDWKPEIHGIAVPLALGNGLPDMVLSAAGPAISRSAASYLAEVRPLLIDAVQQIRGQLGR